MENKIELIADEDGNITGMVAICNGRYEVPACNGRYEVSADNVRLPPDGFKISTNDAGRLLAQYNPDDMFYVRDGYYGSYYMNKKNGNISKLTELADTNKDCEKKLSEQYEISDSRASRLNVCASRLDFYLEMYKRIPKWLRKILFGKYNLRKLEEYEQDENRI